MIKYFVVFFCNDLRELPVKTLRFKVIEVLLKPVTLAWRAVQAMIGYDKDFFQA